MAGELKAARQAFAADVRNAVSTYDVDVLAFDDVAVVAPAITVSTAGQNSVNYLFAIRVYVDTGQSEAAQDLLDDIVSDLTDGLSAKTPDSNWDWEPHEVHGILVMQTIAAVPRLDF